MLRKFIAVGVLAFAFMILAGSPTLNFSNGAAVAALKSEYDVTVTGNIYTDGVGGSKATLKPKPNHQKTYRISALNEKTAKSQAEKEFIKEFTLKTSEKDAKGKIKTITRKPWDIKSSAYKIPKETAPAPAKKPSSTTINGFEANPFKKR